MNNPFTDILCPHCGEFVNPIYGGECPNCGECIAETEDSCDGED